MFEKRPRPVRIRPETKGNILGSHPPPSKNPDATTVTGAKKRWGTLRDMFTIGRVAGHTIKEPSITDPVPSMPANKKLSKILGTPRSQRKEPLPEIPVGNVGVLCSILFNPSHKNHFKNQFLNLKIVIFYCFGLRR